MSTWDDIRRAAVEHITCPYCDAKPGDPCWTKSGRRATYLHDDRSRPISDAYHQGREEMKDGLVRNPSWYARLRAAANAGGLPC